GRSLGPPGHRRRLAAAPQLPGVRGPEHVPGPVRAGVRHPGVQAGGGRLGGPPWTPQIERALGWRSDPRIDDRALPETLAFVAHVVALADAEGGGASAGRW